MQVLKEFKTKIEQSPHPTDIRVKFIEWYRKGQTKLLHETIESLVCVFSDIQSIENDDFNS